jgi:FKBP-type peptidyl-prolyl cis-trans isomerase
LNPKYSQNFNLTKNINQFMSNPNLQITDKVVGTGKAVVSGDIITLHYTGTLENGSKFDSSKDHGEAFTTSIGVGQLIQGWDIGVIGMQVGGTRSLVVPPELGYGDYEIPGIPANSTLHFEIELLDIKAGLQITDTVVGTGKVVEAGDMISIHYTGTLENGSKFDSSVDRGTPFECTIGVGQLIQGWDIGIVGMAEGGKRTLVIPSELGYGQRGAGAKIPGGATLVFEVELLKVFK